MVEHGAYRLLIDLYYVRETPLPADDAALFRLVCARTDDEKQAVSTVLAEFFVRTDEGWRHTRCDEEIARGQEKQSKAKASAAARWDANAMRTHSERIANAMPTQCEGNAPNSQEPIANSQKPITNSQTEEREAKRAREDADAAGAANRSRGTAIPHEFPGEPELAWAEQERPDVSPGAVAVQFRDYHLAHGTTMKSWPAAWRTWVRKERHHAPARASPAQQTALEKQADVIARILRQPAAQPGIVDVFDEQPRLSIARD